MQGIYKITNLQNNKVYIGQSVDINFRWYTHKRNLIAGCHDNKHLQNSWNKYGQDNFEFSIIEECTEDKLTEREQYWIDYYGGLNSSDNYNVKEAGCEGKLSEESKIKISNTLKSKHQIPWNKGLTVDTDERVRTYVEKSKKTFGGHHKQETKEKISKIIQSYHNEGKYDYDSMNRKRLDTIKKNNVVRKDKGTKKGKRSDYIGKAISEGKRNANKRKKELGLPVRNQEYKATPIKISTCTICGSLFVQRKCHHKKTCSSKCRALQIAITNKENRNAIN